MKLCLWVGIFALALGLSADAQWSTKWLQDEAYWGDGKAEFNIYEAREIRQGQPRPSYVIHIYEREMFASGELAKASDPKQSGAYPVLKLNQLLYVPIGIFTEQMMYSAYWKPDTGQLIKATLTASDSAGNTYKEFRTLSGWRTWFSSGWSYHWHTYMQGMSEGNENISAEKDATFYDELPARVRSIDFSPGRGTFAVPLATSVINASKDKVSFTPATIEWRQKGAESRQTGENSPRGTIIVTVKIRGAKGEDVFLLDGQPPHLLREWRKSDGGILKLKRSLKIDYRSYNKLGDQNRLLSELEGAEEHSHEHQHPEKEQPQEEEREKDE